jgi:Secretion system C-terminal sorting domain
MKKILSSLIISWMLIGQATAQKISDHSVKYMVSFDANKSLYTAWLVPNYSTPNHNNPDTEEKGATAQFSLKVPRGFELSHLQSLLAGWDSKPTKLGSEEAFMKAGADANYEYIIIGKSPVETNYGEFKEGEPVALFTFNGNISSNQDKVGVLENEDSFVKIAQETFSLNVASSFYSRSGQAAKVTATPQEQFVQKTSLGDVLNEMMTKMKSENRLIQEEIRPEDKVLTYPNPASEVINVKYFANSEGENAHIYLMNLQGRVLQEQQIKSKLGFNTVQLNIDNLPDGGYTVNTEMNTQAITKKVIKVAK